MKKLILAALAIVFLTVQGKDLSDREYKGKYCSGKGDIGYLQMIDESFAFFHPNPVVPNLTMLYNSGWDTFVEGAGWGAWWIQNSYGFSYAATPFLLEPWISILQHSWDLFWDNQGDGVRKGMWGDGTPNKLSELVAPDGGLGDTAAPGKIIYKQGDGDVDMHDWFYEATAACLVMQAEILLSNRDMTALTHYLPKMERACNFIERTRDPKNNLFLVGPACNLLAPSYGGVKQADGTFGKGYLAGLSVTYLAALDRMVELYKLNGDEKKLAEYQHRQKITRESLSILMTQDGYFVKSVEPDGTKHGVLGQKKFGYLEGVVNADAVALRVVDDRVASGIYQRIESYPAIRPFDFLLTNAPGLDDTYGAWGKTEGKEFRGFWKFGDWVNGGAWGTVEGRAILMYYRLGKFNDIRRSATRAMKWAKDFRMDAPWSQQGENTDNPWSDSGKHHVGGIAVMVDNFAIPAATVRGLFDYDYRADRLIIRPHIPGTISEFNQNEPVHFGHKKIYLKCINGGPYIKTVKVNDKAIEISSPDEVALYYKNLPENAHIEIITTGGYPEQEIKVEYPQTPSLITTTKDETGYRSELPDSLIKPYRTLAELKEKMNGKDEPQYDKILLEEVIRSFDALCDRLTLDPGPGYFRAITNERKKSIEKFYGRATMSMYQGFENRMEKYVDSGNEEEKQMAKLFLETKNKFKQE